MTRTLFVGLQARGYLLMSASLIRRLSVGWQPHAKTRIIDGYTIWRLLPQTTGEVLLEGPTQKRA